MNPSNFIAEQERKKQNLLNSPLAQRLRVRFKEVGYPICDKALLMLLTTTPPETEIIDTSQSQPEKEPEKTTEKVAIFYQELIDFDKMPSDMLVKYKEIENTAKSNGWKITWVNRQMSKIYGEKFDILRQLIETESPVADIGTDTDTTNNTTDTTDTMTSTRQAMITGIISQWLRDKSPDSLGIIPYSDDVEAVIYNLPNLNSFLRNELIDSWQSVTRTHT